MGFFILTLCVDSTRQVDPGFFSTEAGLGWETGFWVTSADR